MCVPTSGFKIRRRVLGWAEWQGREDSGDGEWGDWDVRASREAVGFPSGSHHRSHATDGHSQKCSACARPAQVCLGTVGLLPLGVSAWQPGQDSPREDRQRGIQRLRQGERERQRWGGSARMRGRETGTRTRELFRVRERQRGGRWGARERGERKRQTD